jgi:hypothetical protein
MEKRGCFVKGLGNGFILGVILFTVLGFSFPAFGASLNLGEATGNAGSDVTIAMTLTTGGLQIAAVAMDIGYNTSLLENPRVEIGPAGTAAGKQVISSTPFPGVFRIGVLSIMNNNAIGDGIVANVTFKVKDTASGGDTTLTNAPSASSPSGNPVSITGQNGLIHIVTAPPAQLNVGSASGNAGGSVTLPITLVTKGNSISATSNDLHYDPSELQNPRATIGPAGSAAGKDVVSNVVTPGLFRIGVFSIQNNNPMGDGVVAYVTFDIVGSIQCETAIVIENESGASSPEGDPIPVEGTDGTITVICINITPDAFPLILDSNGFAGVMGQWPLTVSGGQSPYAWSIIEGALPNGLTFNSSTGLISGKPLQTGIFPFRVKVTDQVGTEATKDLSLKISLLGDANGNGSVAINELQIVINSYLGIYPPKGGSQIGD